LLCGATAPAFSRTNHQNSQQIHDPPCPPPAFPVSATQRFLSETLRFIILKSFDPSFVLLIVPNTPRPLPSSKRGLSSRVNSTRANRNAHTSSRQRPIARGFSAKGSPTGPGRPRCVSSRARRESRKPAKVGEKEVGGKLGAPRPTSSVSQTRRRHCCSSRLAKPPENFAAENSPTPQKQTPGKTINFSPEPKKHAPNSSANSPRPRNSLRLLFGHASHLDGPSIGPTSLGSTHQTSTSLKKIRCGSPHRRKNARPPPGGETNLLSPPKILRKKAGPSAALIVAAMGGCQPMFLGFLFFCSVHHHTGNGQSFCFRDRQLGGVGPWSGGTGQTLRPVLRLVLVGSVAIPFLGGAGLALSGWPRGWAHATAFNGLQTSTTHAFHLNRHTHSGVYQEPVPEGACVCSWVSQKDKKNTGI